MNPAVRRGRVWRWPLALAPEDDALAVEEPLEIRVEGEPLAVLMRTPGRDLDLAAGFLLTEGVIGGRDDLAALAPLTGPRAANTVDCRLSEGVLAHRERLDTARRALYATSACGVCGKASIDRLRLQAPPVPPSALAAERAARLGAMLADHQPGFRATGGLHGAALFSDAPAPEGVAEDVGRHNAVDKVVGAWVRAGTPFGEAHALVVSSRAGFEIVQKAWMAGLPAVVAVGAPTSLAVELAEEAGIRLFGFARGDRVTRYA